MFNGQEGEEEILIHFMVLELVSKSQIGWSWRVVECIMEKGNSWNKKHVDLGCQQVNGSTILTKRVIIELTLERNSGLRCDQSEMEYIERQWPEPFITIEL